MPFGARQLGIAFLGIGMLAIQESAGREPTSEPADAATSQSAASIEFFEKNVRPVLVKHCYECHSTQAKELQAGLQLDSHAAVLRGGDSGPAVVEGNADDSRLIQAVRYESFEMPPDGKLSPRVIADLEKWIEIGAPWPAERVGQPTLDPIEDRETRIANGRGFWSFQPVTEFAVPAVSDASWPRNKIDYFVLSNLEDLGMRPAPGAAKRTLIRRLYYDLIGLPPNFEEVESFIQDDDPRAYEKLVDRLLASPHYGEHWARYWLDLVRYGEDNPNGAPSPLYAFRYRDWVIHSLNQDLPYDEFVRRQLAADFFEELPKQELAALGFLGTSPMYFKGPKLDKDVLSAIVADEWEERIDVVSRTLLGLTVACARCHDHKFDPITTDDYYALAGVMASTQIVERPMVDILDEDAFYITELTEELRYHQQRYNQRFNQREGLKKSKAPDVYRYDKEILESASEIQRITSLLPESYDRIPRVNAVRDAKSSIDNSFYVIRELISPEARFWTTLQYDAGQAQDVSVHIRGNASQLGETIPRRFIEVLSTGSAEPFQIGSGRLELANAILGEASALAGRVIVNRIWGWHFGQPLVGTPSNLGQLGDRPTHPDLLSDLTSRFISGGWSLKQLHRELVLSATYRQTSRFDATYQAIDPENRHLWRMNRRRLNVEHWRDSTLKIVGELETHIGGSSSDLESADMRRRTIYGKVSRKSLTPLYRLFDYPEATRHNPERNVTTTPLQQLYFMNSKFIRRRSAQIAQSLTPIAGESVEGAICSIFHKILARDPSDDEVDMGKQLLSNLGEPVGPDAWAVLAQALLVSNEFLFVD